MGERRLTQEKNGMVAASTLIAGAHDEDGEQSMHAIRNHLANVRLALEMLCRKAAPNSREAKVAEVGLSSWQRLAQLLLVKKEPTKAPSGVR